MGQRTDSELEQQDGLIIVVKRDCATCTLIEPVLIDLAASGAPVRIFSQDDPSFPAGAKTEDDSALKVSYQLDIETVPTLIRMVDGQEVERSVGWQRDIWRRIIGLPELGAALPTYRPGCGSRSVEPGMADRLALLYGDIPFQARTIDLAMLEDEIEACYDRGWSDGLPVVPPTPERVLRMLSGTERPPDQIIGLVPPNRVPCTVEKVAINAVLAGCLPEYLPIVLAAVEAALLDEFCMHGLLATTWFSGPVVVVNGPLARLVGMNGGTNALGQGNRANATIGRALQLVIRNVGGGVPGGVDRSALGNPGKYTFCFSENEADSPWESLAVERGFADMTSTVTLFAGDGVQGIFDQQSRTPESLARSFAACLKVVAHPKIVGAADAMLIVSPEHGRIFRQAGWSKQHLREALEQHLLLAGKDIVRGAGGIAEGMPAQSISERMPKFRTNGLHIVHAGGSAGLFSAVIGGWVAGGPKGSQAVSMPIGK